MDAASPPPTPGLVRPHGGADGVESTALFSLPGNISDEALADAIDRDVADRLVQGLPIELEPYLSVIGDVARRPLALDAAVDGALRAIVAGGVALPAAVERLGARHPDLRRVIESTATITMLFGPSGSAIDSMERVEERRLPSRFGRVLPEGQGRYELVEALGARRPARVFRAIDHLLSRPDAQVEVVVKILGRAGDQAQLDEAIEEARLLRSIRHEAVVSLVDSGVSDDAEVYLVTEFVQGASLREQVEQRGRIAPVEAARLVSSLAHAVGIAHRAGVIHCDLSPSNLLVTGDGRVRIVDLGSAAHIGTASPFERAMHGTPGFMAPEQGDPAQRAAPTLDVYALGAVLFWMLTGSSANGRDATEIDLLLRGGTDLRGWRHHELEAAATPSGLLRLTLAAIEVDPALRPADAEALAVGLDTWLEQEALSQLPWLSRAGAWWRRHPRSALLLTVAATVALTLSLVNTFMTPSAPPRRGAEYTLMAARSDRAIAYGMSRFDRSLRIDRDEARAMLARVPQILGTGRSATPALRAWMEGPEGARLASLLSGLQIISGRHGESTQIDALVLRTALAALLLAQQRDPGPVLRSGGSDLELLLSPGDPLRTIAVGVRRAATARAVAEGVRFGRTRPGWPAPDVALVELDASIRENEAAERDVIVGLIREQRGLLAAAMVERSSTPGASTGSTEGADALRQD